MQSFCAVKPVSQQASRSVGAAARWTRIIACMTALFLLGVLVLAVAAPGNRTSLLNRAVPQPDDAYDGQQLMINGDTVLGNAGLIGLQNLRKVPVAKLEEGSPLLNDSPQASSVYDDGDIGPAGSQQGEKPGHWGGVGSENYGTPLWDNTVCGYVNCLCVFVFAYVCSVSFVCFYYFLCCSSSTFSCITHLHRGGMHIITRGMAHPWTQSPWNHGTGAKARGPMTNTLATWLMATPCSGTFPTVRLIALPHRPPDMQALLHSPPDGWEPPINYHDSAYMSRDGIPPSMAPGGN
jgi:hypothetical protein